MEKAYDNPGDWKSIEKNITKEENLKESNPNYNQGTKWQINCQRCVPTYEMRCRGFDVTALPKPKFSDYLSYHPFEVWEEPEVHQCKWSGLEDIRNLMSEWGDGARAQVVVVWNSTAAGHTFFAEQVNGETHFYDPQTGDMDVLSYFECVQNGFTEVCRIDNLKVSDRILDCCKGADD